MVEKKGNLLSGEGKFGQKNSPRKTPDNTEKEGEINRDCRAVAEAIETYIRKNRLGAPNSAKSDSIRDAAKGEYGRKDKYELLKFARSILDNLGSYPIVNLDELVSALREKSKRVLLGPRY